MDLGWWDDHRGMKLEDGPFSDCGNNVAFKEKLSDRLYQVLGHVTFVVGHSDGHDKLGRASTVLVELDSMGFWDESVRLAVDD